MRFIFIEKKKSKTRCENNSELTKGVELDQIYLSKRKSQKVVVKTKKKLTAGLELDDFF